MLNICVKYLGSETELNEFLKQFNVQKPDALPVIKKITYLPREVEGSTALSVTAVVEYIDGEPEPVEEEPVEEKVE